MLILNGEIVNLREITELDTDNIIKWRNNPKVKKHFIYQEDFTRESHLSWYHNKVQTKEVAQFIIVNKEEARDIGSIYLRDIDLENKRAEYGIFIGEDTRKRKGVRISCNRTYNQTCFSRFRFTQNLFKSFCGKY